MLNVAILPGRATSCKSRARLPVLRSWMAKRVEHAGTFRTGAHRVGDVARGAPKITFLYGYFLVTLNAHSRAFQKHAPLLFGVMVQGAFGVRGPGSRPRASPAPQKKSVSSLRGQVRGTARLTYRRDCGIPWLDPYPLLPPCHCWARWSRSRTPSASCRSARHKI
jgi:hypothetical protein